MNLEYELWPDRPGCPRAAYALLLGGAPGG